MSDQFLDISLPDDPATAVVATLGPAGTSSEAAAAALRQRIGATTPTMLCDRYEDAALAVEEGRADLLLVANAYSNVNDFYMSPELCLAAVFVHQTPEYGLATLPDAEVSGEVSVASHPAPIPIINQLLPAHLSVHRVLPVQSTSVAAAAVRSGQAEVALTTAPAVSAYRLNFISRTRPITMLWSVFRRACPRCRALVGEASAA